uniref:DNA-directed RNA polymerase RpoA/D/Rpb3-type domain-containing protein n=1 Tax=Ditylenchus dipsaci TaxID=166011 RepID=A0A915EM05_9BILA
MKRVKREISSTEDEALIMREESAYPNHTREHETWDLDEYLSKFSITFVHESEDRLDVEFDMQHVGTSVANAIRRVLIAEVPSMAIEKVFLYQNTSVIPDEVLCHRLGLLPVYANPFHFNFPPYQDLTDEEKDKSNDLDEEPLGDHKENIIFELHVKCKKKKSVLFAPILQMDSYWQASKMSKLRPGQEIEVRCHCVKGVGRDHAKFSPAQRLISSFSEGVIGINEYTGVAFVKDARKDTCSRNIFQHEDIKDAVSMSKNMEHFIFSVESTGAVNGLDLTLAALHVIQAKLKHLHGLVRDKLEGVKKSSTCFGALGEAVGLDANALMGILQNALNQAPVPPVIQPIEMQAFVEETGFQFLQNRKNKDGSKQDWRCENYPEKNGGCKASLQTVTTGNVFTKFKPHDGTCAHNHSLDEKAVTLSIIKSNLKRRAVETREKPMELLNHELQSAPLAVCPSLSSSAVRKTIRRVRIANQIPIVEGRNVQDIDIPRESRMYTDGAGRQQLFFLGDSGRDDAERILLFGKERHIDWSGEMKLMYLDGSFQMTPPPFYQVYAFLAERTTRINNGGKYVFPVLYALLKNKLVPATRKCSTWLGCLASIRSDIYFYGFRKGRHPVGNRCVNIAGCLFHLVKNFKKQIAAHGLSARNQEPEFSLRAKMLMSLAFVPPENIWNDFRLLKTHLLSYDQVLVRSSIGLKHIMSALQCVIQCSQFVGGPAMKEPLLGKTERITLQRLLIVDFTLLWAWIIRM